MSPAMSVTCRYAGYWDGGFHRSHKKSFVGSSQHSMFLGLSPSDEIYLRIGNQERHIEPHSARWYRTDLFCVSSCVKMAMVSARPRSRYSSSGSDNLREHILLEHAERPSRGGMRNKDICPQFSAAALCSVNRLNRLDFPTLGRPTHPIFRFFRTRPKATTLSLTSSVVFFGAMMRFSWCRVEC